MEAAVMQPRARRIRTLSKPKVERELGDEYAISLIEEAVKAERVSREQVMNSLRRR